MSALSTVVVVTWRGRDHITACLDALSAHGYAFQIETTYRVLRAGLRVREIPIRFTERRAGASKMTGAIVAEAVWKVPRLRLRALFGKL